MTKRLYYPREEQDTLSCTARVLECREDQDGYEICLDATVIFPEGGGQLSDQGQLCHIETGAVMAEVTHAREEGDLVFHRTDRPIQPGTQVLVKAREDLRQDHSAQHSGEHVLSGLAYTLFGAKNVGFHMAADYVTLDLDIFLDEEKLHALELAANQAVQRNLPTRVQVVDGADLAGMTLRKKAAGLTGPVRIVYVAGVDSCTCCGTHVAYAGEIGYIHLDSAAKYKGGTRLWFSCGMRGVERAWQEKTELDKLARRFSTKSEDVVEAVARQGDELSSCKRELKQRTGELLTYRAGELLAKGEAIGGVRLAAALLEGLDMGDKKQRAQARRHVGLVFQYPEYQLFEETVARDVAYGPRNMGLGEEEIQRRVDTALGLVGLPPQQFGEKSPFSLSGGERRRAALAGVIAMEPKYLILDEPMAGLDPQGRRDILHTIDGLREKTGCGVVMVSHSMEDVAQCADRIAVLHQGRLVQADTPGKIFQAEDTLQALGLELPAPCKLAAALRKRGMDVPHLYTAEALTAFLLERRGHV